MKSLVKLVPLILVLSNICLMTSCGCSHDWENATCEKPVTCSLCGETAGDPLGHKWKDATCTEPKMCENCEQISGEALGHSWREANCMTAKTCSACGETEGAALGHKWNNATYSAPKTCSSCGATEGTSLSKPIEPSEPAVATCLLCDSEPSRRQTQYCSSHDCDQSDCPYPAKSSRPGSYGSFCIYHSCEKNGCVNKKQQPELPYCNSHLAELSRDEIEELWK